MELDAFKSTWQSALFSTEEKAMSDIQTMIQQQSRTVFRRITRRYGRIVTSTLVAAVAFLIFFYTISDGYRESPGGLALGMIVILSFSMMGWLRYRQYMTLDMAVNLKRSLEMLIDQLMQNRRQEQLFVVGTAVLGVTVPRLINGRGFTNLLQADVLIALLLTAGLIGGILLLIRRSYQQDISELQSLLAQLTGG